MEQNFDESILVNQRIDSSSNQPVLHQILRIAIYDEFHAYEVYSRVIEKYGPIAPFSQIVEAENRHYNRLLPLFEKYQVPVPINDWYHKITIPETFVECCEIGVAAEIDNIAMYDHLLAHTQDADIQDALFILQAASFNHHLPAFRQCIARHYAPYNMATAQPHQAQNEQPSTQADESITQEKIQEYQSLIESVMSGNIDQKELTELLQKSNLALISGLLTGVIGTMMLNNFKSASGSTSSDEADNSSE